MSYVSDIYLIRTCGETGVRAALRTMVKVAERREVKKRKEGYDPMGDFGQFQFQICEFEKSKK